MWLGPGRVKQDAMPPAIFLAASNYNSLKDLPWKFLFYHKNNQF